MVHFANVADGSIPAETSNDDDLVQSAENVATLAVVNRGSADFARMAELERLGDSIAELAAHLHAATHRLLVMLAEFDRRGGWGGGFRSCAHWLSWRTGINLGAAREKVRVARALERLPAISDALRRGRLSYAIVRALTRIATPENECKLLEVAQHGTASQVERVVRAWRRVDRLEEQWAEREQHRSRYLHLYADADGMYVLRGRLPPEVGALLERALAAANEMLYRKPHQPEPASGNATSHEQRQADAIGLLAEWALGRSVMPGQHDTAAAVAEIQQAASAKETTGPDIDIAGTAEPEKVAAEPCTDAVQRENEVAATAAEPQSAAPPPEHRAAEPFTPALRARRASLSRAERFQVVLHVDVEALRAGSQEGQAVLAGGIRISAETSRRIACDASRVVMLHDRDGSILDVGRRTRTIPPAIRRALEHRDRGCRFPGCGLQIVDAHHIEHWIDGGRTKLRNLVLLCRRYHRAVHEEGFGVQTSATGEISFIRPDGRPLPDAPAIPPIAENAVEQLVATNRELGLEIDAWTPTPDWHGERLDLDYAIRALRAG